MAHNCSWCGKEIGKFDFNYIYEQIGDKEHRICNECSAKIFAAKNGKATLEGIKTEQTNLALFNYYVEQIKTSEEISTSGDSYTFHYVISFLIPLIGFIVGAVMLANDNAEKRSCGKTCIIIGIISMIIYAVFTGAFWL